MLVSLRIRDFVIVDRLELDFAAGLTVLTGETGAGKSILLDALGLVLGERADASMVRSQCERAEIEAEFDLAAASAARDWLVSQDLDDDGYLLLRRIVDAGGRSRAFINGRSATLQQIRDVGELLIDIHGQHAHQSLLRADSQRQLVDAYAGQAGLARRVRDAYSGWVATGKQRVLHEQNAAAYAAEREQLQWQVQELEALDCSAQHWAEWQSEQSRLAHAASLIEGCQQSAGLLSDDDGNCVASLVAALHCVNDLCRFDTHLNEVAEMLASAEIQIREAAQTLRRYGQRIDLDPQRLQAIDAKLDAALGAARKYRVSPEQLEGVLAQKRGRLQQLGTEQTDADWEAREQEAEKAYRDLASQLTTGRIQAAQALSERVSGEMRSLAMDRGRFEVSLQPVAPAATGSEQIEFLVSANTGMVPRPLGKVASGGELSRISLALQVVVSQVASVPVLVFDEVDVGIGGAVAEVVGQLLRRLGKHYQVLCVTHLPQVAAYGNNHWRVEKLALEGQTLSRIEKLDQAGRIDEIARMLGGVDITDTTRQHAREMLSSCNRV